MQTTLVLLKPDAIDRGIVGKIISRIENKGLKITAMRMMQLSESIIDEHYIHLKDKPFFSEIKEYMTRTPIIAMAVYGNNSIKLMRKITGSTDPQEADVGTIRGDFGISIAGNIIHSSDNENSAELELERFFSKQGFYIYERAIDKAFLGS